jgi:ParB family transcriptional regulator, chromosome partitioning protein
VARPTPGIGRGLQAILSASDERRHEGDSHEQDDELRELPLELIVPNPRQPRRHLDTDALQALAYSVGERGVLQPVLVRPKAGGTYELIAGERRWQAARIAGLDRIPALVRARADAEALELAVIENMAREDLSPLEEALACAALIEELGLTRAEVGRRVGRSRVAISNLMRLLELSDEVLELLQRGSLSEGHGRALLLAHDHGERTRLAHAAVDGGWSVRTLEERARLSNGTPPRERITGRTRAGAHPDQIQAAHEIEEMLAGALGTDVRATPSRGGGYRVELRLSSVEDAHRLVKRLRPRAVA